MLALWTTCHTRHVHHRTPGQSSLRTADGGSGRGHEHGGQRRGLKTTAPHQALGVQNAAPRKRGFNELFHRCIEKSKVLKQRELLWWTQDLPRVKKP